MSPIKCRIFAKLGNKFVTNRFDFISFFLALYFAPCFFSPEKPSVTLHVTSNALYNLWLQLVYCQRASRAKTRGCWGGSIIEPCESTVQAKKSLVICKVRFLRFQRHSKNCNGPIAARRDCAWLWSPLFLLLPHFVVSCDLLLNRRYMESIC